MGENLMDHMGVFGGLTFFKGQIKGMNVIELANPIEILKYKKHRTGTL